MLIVNKTMSEVGFICDDYNGFTDDKEEEVSKLLDVVKKSHNDELAKHNMKPIKDLYYSAMKQVDDGRPGMALELGMNMFSDGNPAMNVRMFFWLTRTLNLNPGNASPIANFGLYAAK